VLLTNRRKIVKKFVQRASLLKVVN
jgi:hypothetical protein